MNQIAILVPVLNRPQNARPLVASALRSTKVRHSIVFLCSPGDDLEIKACRETVANVHVVDWEPGPGDWAKKINRGFAITSEEFVLLGADDLCFHEGWDMAVLGVARQSGAGVVGTNDLGNATVMRGHQSSVCESENVRASRSPAFASRAGSGASSCSGLQGSAGSR